jgi:hypothetical protein
MSTHGHFVEIQQYRTMFLDRYDIDLARLHETDQLLLTDLQERTPTVEGSETNDVT